MKFVLVATPMLENNISRSNPYMPAFLITIAATIFGTLQKSPFIW